MSSGVIVTMGVFVLIGLFGLIILLDRKKTEREEAAAQRGAEIQMTPTERWDAHVEQLQKRES